MDISPTTLRPTDPSATPASPPDTTGAGSMITSDFETFLTMLTTQMQNQDPLNPIESTDFAVQLATFSGVEQQVQTNDLLAAMSAQLGAMNLSDLGGWVGMEVRAAVPTWFEDTPIALHPDPASGAERAFVVVKDESGTTVDRVEIPVSDAPISWAGVSALGQPVPPGTYSFHLQSISQGAIIQDAPIAVFSEVVEARVEEGITMLVLSGGAVIPAGEADAIRAPEAPL